MVRLNKQTDFQFPFVQFENQAFANGIESRETFKQTDLYLSLFATILFMALLLMISLDFSSNEKSNISNHSKVNTNVQSSMMIPLVNFDNLLEESNEEIVLKNEESAPSTIHQVEKQLMNKPSVHFAEEKKEIAATTIVKPEKIVIKKKRAKRKKQVNTLHTTFQENNKSTLVPDSTPKRIKAKLEITNKTKNPNSKYSVNHQIPEDALPQYYFDAKEKALKEGKLLFLKFGAKWCLPCRKMNETTFTDEEVRSFMEKNYVKLTIDVEDFDGVNLKSYFNVKMLPTLLIFNPSGKFVAKYAKFLSAKKMLNILEKHYKETKTSPLKENRLALIKDLPKVLSPQVVFNKIQLKKNKSGKIISTLKSKAKNWRFTQLDFNIKNITEGELLLKVKETQSNKLLSEQRTPMHTQGKRIADAADATTTNFQLVIPHEKRKKKKGDYVLEVYHLNQGESQLIGKTTLIKGGKILL